MAAERIGHTGDPNPAPHLKRNVWELALDSAGPGTRFFDALEAQDRVNLENQKLRYDELTGLPNRTSFKQSVDKWKKVHSADDRFSLAVIDLNALKQINDTYGHNMGDDVLVVIAYSMRNIYRQGEERTIDIPGRWGGDEFVIFSPYEPEVGNKVADHEAYALDTKERLLRELKRVQPGDIINGRIRVTVELFDVLQTVGFAVGSSFYQNQDLEQGVEPLIKLADQRMYEDKERDRLSSYTG